MSQRAYPQLEQGQIIPAFTLPGADGMPHSPWDYKQRTHLILLFIRSATTDEGHDILGRFAAHYPALREEVCSILAITAEPVIVNLAVQEKLHFPFPLLSDPKGDVIARYTAWDCTTKRLAPCIILADRYGALYQQWTVETEAMLPPITALLDSLQYINKLCTP